MARDEVYGVLEIIFIARLMCVLGEFFVFQISFSSSKNALGVPSRSRPRAQYVFSECFEGFIKLNIVSFLIVACTRFQLFSIFITAYIT